MGISRIFLALAAMSINHSLGNHITDLPNNHMTREREIELRQMEDDSKKHSIVTYDKATANVDEVVAKLKTECDNCDAEVLGSIATIILYYPSSDHPTASQMLKIPGIRHAEEDVVVSMEDFHPANCEVCNAEEKIRRENAGMPECQSCSTPNDPKFADQWELQETENNADINWQAGVEEYLSDDGDSVSVVVAVIDTGIDYNHPDLKDVMWKNTKEIPDDGIDNDGNGYIDDVYGVDITSDDEGNPIDRQGHGTHCAGTIAAQSNNNAGIAGVASAAQNKVKLMAVKVLSDSGAGEWSWLLKGLNYAIEQGAKISSNSLGGEGHHRALKDALDANPDHLFINAAGNSNLDINEEPYTPCSTNAATQICVGATTKSDTRSYFSNYGKPYVHVMAPGSSILSTYLGNTYKRLSGTSMACPQVSGLAAMLMTMREGMTPIQVKMIIEGTVQSKPQYKDVATSGGLIDVFASINSVISGTMPTTTVPTTPANYVCTDIKLETKAYGYEISWTFGSCSSEARFSNKYEYEDYEDNTVYSTKCCQPPGNYTLTCKDSYGDGWNGGYIEIGSQQYCKDSKQKTLEFKQKTVNNVRHSEHV